MEILDETLGKYTKPFSWVKVPIADGVVEFGGEPSATYAISGWVRDFTGPGMSGVTVTLSGAKSATTTTDANGNYLFKHVANHEAKVVYYNAFGNTIKARLGPEAASSETGTPLFVDI